jgi:TIR domain
MGVFISWSGKTSKSYQVAVALRDWLKLVVQHSNPWSSAQDIDAGQRWASELFEQLDKHKIGIICVTKENQAEPWLNFEAGALAKQLDKTDGFSHVCPLLIEMTMSDVTGPLKLLQMVALDKEGLFKIVEMVNKHAIDSPLLEEDLRTSFEQWWPRFEDELKKMKVPDTPPKSSRGTPEMLEEILGIVRSLDRTVSQPSPISPATVYSLLLPGAIPTVETYFQRLPSRTERLEALDMQDKVSSYLRAADSSFASAIERLPVSVLNGRLVIDLFAIPSLEHAAGEQIIRDLCAILSKLNFEVVVRTSRAIPLE